MPTSTHILTPEQVFYLFLVLSKIDEGDGFTPMQANKLVYISHGWSLGLFDTPLIYNEFREIEAWKHGPVVVSLYHELKHFGKEKIDIKKYDKYKDKKHGADYVANKIISDIRNAMDEQDNKAVPLLKWVYKHYGDWEAWELSGATHQRGTPWYIRRHSPGLNNHIDDDIIKEYYKSRIKE